MVFGVIEKTFVGYGIVIVVGALGFIAARYKVYDDRDVILATRGRIYKTVSNSRDFEKSYPYYTDEARKKFYEDLAEKKNSSNKQ